jgi:NADPH2:quinone reductase
MRAVTYSHFGPAADVLTLQEMETPEPGPGEVRVSLCFSAVNPSDVKSRAGRPGLDRPAFDQIIPHSDGSGVINAVGEGIDPDRIGEKVWIWNGQWQRPFGTAATHIILPSEQAVELPEGVDFATGATLGIPGLTACHAVLGGGPVSGQTVLIQGGAGTVGLLAVQLAKWAGAKVIATCSARDFDSVRRAGADAVVDYRDENLTACILDANNGALIETVVEVEFSINLAVDAEVIAPNGRLAAYGSHKDMNPTLPFFPLLFKAVTIDIILVYLLTRTEREAAIAYLHTALIEGRLECPIDDLYPLSRTAAAHEAVEKEERHGAILLECQG